MKIRVQKVEIGSELLGHFVKFQMIFEDIVQEIESHVEDLKSEEFLGILKEFYVSQQNTQPMIHFQFTNLRKSLIRLGHFQTKVFVASVCIVCLIFLQVKGGVVLRCIIS